MNTSDNLEHKKERGAFQPPRVFGLGSSSTSETQTIYLLVAGVDLRSGDLCPRCQIQRLNYDGLLNLTCPGCGYSPGGGCFS